MLNLIHCSILFSHIPCVLDFPCLYHRQRISCKIRCTAYKWTRDFNERVRGGSLPCHNCLRDLLQIGALSLTHSLSPCLRSMKSRGAPLLYIRLILASWYLTWTSCCFLDFEEIQTPVKCPWSVNWIPGPLIKVIHRMRKVICLNGQEGGLCRVKSSLYIRSPLRG